MKHIRPPLIAVIIAVLVAAGMSLLTSPASAGPSYPTLVEPVKQTPDPVIVPENGRVDLRWTLVVDSPSNWTLTRADLYHQPFMGNPYLGTLKIVSVIKNLQQYTIVLDGPNTYVGYARGWNAVYPRLTFSTPSGDYAWDVYNGAMFLGATSNTLAAPESVAYGAGLSLTGKFTCFINAATLPADEYFSIEFKRDGQSDWSVVGRPLFAAGDANFGNYTFFVPSTTQSGTWRMRFAGDVYGGAQWCAPNASPERHVQVGDAPVTSRAPGAVASVGLSDATPTTMVVSWTSPSDPGTSPITGYKIGWIEENGRVWVTDAPHVRLNQSPLTLINLRPGTRYDVEVSAISAAGQGPVTWKTLRTPGNAPNPTPPPPVDTPPSPVVTPPTVVPPPPPATITVSPPPATPKPPTTKAPLYAPVKTFKSCTKMHKVYAYRGGIAKNAAARAKARSPKPYVGLTRYRLNRALDRDRDKIACER